MTGPFVLGKEQGDKALLLSHDGDTTSAEIQRPVRAMSSAAKLLQALFHGLDLGLELGQVRIELGNHLGLAPVAATESAVPTFAAAAPLATVAAALALSTVTATPALSAVTTAPAAPGRAATLAAGLALALRTAFATLAMMLVMVLVSCLAVAHDQPLFRGLAERRSATDSYSVRNSPRYVLVLRISATQVSRCSRPTLVIS
jgi:hypothetical protein